MRYNSNSLNINQVKMQIFNYKKLNIYFVRYFVFVRLINRLGGEKMTEFDEIYNMYFKDVYYFVISLCNDEHIAEDVTSETYLKAINSIDKFKGNCDIRVWLFQIAKNSYYSYLRKNKKIAYSNEFVEFTEDTNPSGNIEHKIIDKEDSKRIHKILHDLKEPYKEIFTLRVFGDLSFKQIGELFGKTDNWACVNFHRAKKKIKDQLKD